VKKRPETEIVSISTTTFGYHFDQFDYVLGFSITGLKLSSRCYWKEWFLFEYPMKNQSAGITFSVNIC